MRELHKPPAKADSREEFGLADPCRLFLASINVRKEAAPVLASSFALTGLVICHCQFRILVVQVFLTANVQVLVEVHLHRGVSHELWAALVSSRKLVGGIKPAHTEVVLYCLFAMLDT